MMEKPQTTQPNSRLDPVPDRYRMEFSVSYDYPVCFTSGLFDPDNELFAETLNRLGENRRHRAAVWVDAGVAAAHPRLIERIREYFHARPDELELAASPEILAGGEAAKRGWKTVREIMWALGNLHLDRQSYIVAVGGGGVLDMVGFAASIVHRGLRLVRMPTTTLAQNDAGVGVKNGMNEHGQKNFVGTFAPPFAVLNDVEFLPTLSQRDWIGGVAEAFKVAIIKDAAFFERLCEQADALRERSLAAMDRIVRRCAVLHLEHIRTGGDPFEFGSARPLDFGHWAGHRLEILSGYALGHGQCIAIGMALDLHYAWRHGWFSREDLERALDAMQRCGLPIWSPHLGARKTDGTPAILDGLEQFREHLGGTLTVTLPDGLGRRREVHQVDGGTIEQGIQFLAARAGRG